MSERPEKLTPEQLKARWETPEGRAFRAEIIGQLQSEEPEHTVDWENLKVLVNNEERIWKHFPGVEESVEGWSAELYTDEYITWIVDNFGYRIAMNAVWGDMRGLSLSYKSGKICNANLQFVNMRLAELDFTELKNITFYSAHMDSIDFSLSKLNQVAFNQANLANANFDSAKLDNVYFSKANLENARLYNAKFSNTIISGVNLQNANLSKARLKNVNLSGANLQGANLNYATFIIKSFWCRVWECLGLNIARFRATLFNGADLTDIKLGSDPTLRRQLLDEVYLDKFAEHHKFFYPFWLLTSNCGRNPLLVGFWALLIGLFFGFIFGYHTYPLPDWAWLSWLKDILVIDEPMFVFDEMKWWQPFYLSLTTLTTLGWAGPEPNTTAGFLWHTMENIIGYVMLGYLIAVIGDLLTRRSA